MKKKMLLMILLLTLTTSCTTFHQPTVKDLDLPTLESARPVKPKLIEDAITTSDLINNYNEVVGYCKKLEAHIDAQKLYTTKLINILTINDI